MSTGFDLTSAKPVAAAEDEGQEVHVHDEHGEPMYFGEDRTPVTMTVAGTYSSTYRRAEEAMTTRRLKRRVRHLSAQELRHDQLNLAAACVLRWNGFYDGGKELECSRANVVRVFEAAPWIRDQAEQAMEDHAGFFANSSRS